MVVAVLLVAAVLSGCAGQRQEIEEAEMKKPKIVMETAQAEEQKDDGQEYDLDIHKNEDGDDFYQKPENLTEEYGYIDYDYIEQYHKILFHNIAASPKDDYEDTVLAEYLKADIEKDAQSLETGSGKKSPLKIKYHMFDFNDDGLEDYLVCYHAPYYSGTAGNSVEIYVQKSDGSLSRVFNITMRLYDYVSPYEHSPMAILDEKDDGYYAFVLVGNNRIMRYNGEEGRYDFEDKSMTTP